MIKISLMPLLLIIACLFAGLYGAIHNQISYSVSPEYFTAFKFHQFHIDSRIPPRLGAAVVGWHAAWWMGAIIGIVLIPLGLIIRGGRNYFRGMLCVFAVVTGTTLVTGLIALSWACSTIGEQDVGKLVVYGNEIIDRVAFMRAGTMHNFSYLGGLIGILTGGIAVFILKNRSGKTSA